MASAILFPPSSELILEPVADLRLTFQGGQPSICSSFMSVSDEKHFCNMVTTHIVQARKLYIVNLWSLVIVKSKQCTLLLSSINLTISC